jgi:hypothetical protein
VTGASVLSVSNGFTLRFQVAIHRHQHFAAQIVLLKKVAEAEDRGFIRCRGYAKIHSSKALQQRGIIKRFLHAGIRKAEPLLQKVGPKHDRNAHRLPAIARLGINRLNQRQQL